MATLLCVVLLIAQADNTILPVWMTPEESLRINEIGKGHVVTAPPGGWVETPAEFEPLRGVFVTWRWNTTYNSIFREIVREVVSSCKANIIPASASETTSIKNYLTSGGIPLDSVRFYIYSNNSVWSRDYGPWFMRKQDNTEGIVDFKYNRPRPLDDTIPWRIGQSWGIPVYGSPLVHAGGNFMVDGLGTGFCSTLLYEENSSYTPQRIDSLMLAYNGLERLIVLKRIITEYTGHIDLWTKILNDTLIMVGEYATGHANDTVLDNRADSISHCKNREGFNYRVVRIPMPWSTASAPPTYLNSLIANKKVLVPTWSLAEDTTALRIYRDAMPGYTVVGINCSSMSGSGGAIHCITMQVPSSRYVHIRHIPLTNTTDTINPYRVRARIVTSSNLITDSTKVDYKINNAPIFTSVPLSAVVDTPGVYVGYIPPQHRNDTVYYYLVARNIQSIRRTSPVDCPPHVYKFLVGPPTNIEGHFAAMPDCKFVVYPNPAQKELTFAINLDEKSNLKIEIYNSLGQKLKVLTHNVFAPGNYSLKWNLRNDRDCPLAQGIYFYRIVINDTAETGKVLLVR